MSLPVNGTDIMLYYHDVATDTDIPFACAKTSFFEISPTFKNVTDYASAFFIKQKPDIASWQMGVSGLVILSNYSYLFISDLITARTSILVKYVIDNGADGLVIYAGSCYPAQLRIDGNYNEAAIYTCTLVGTGAFNSTGTTVTPIGVVITGGTVTRFEYTVPADGVTITIGATIGASVITVFARGTAGEPTIIYTGSPTGDEVKFTSSTGVFEVGIDTPFLAGEKIWGNMK